MRFTPETLSSPSSLSSCACFFAHSMHRKSMAACSCESVCDSQLGKKSTPEKLQTGRGTHPSQACTPPSLQTHTVHNSLSLLATVPNCNNGCFLKTRVMVTSWATSRRCVKAQELTNRKEPRSYPTTNHHSKGFLWEGPAQQRNWFHIHALFPKTSSSNYTNISQGKVQLTGLLLLNAVWLSF